MDLPVSTLKAQLDAVYIALDIVCRDREKRLVELAGSTSQVNALMLERDEAAKEAAELRSEVTLLKAHIAKKEEDSATGNPDRSEIMRLRARLARAHAAAHARSLEVDRLRAAYRRLVQPFADLFVKHEALRAQAEQHQQALAAADAGYAALNARNEQILAERSAELCAQIVQLQQALAAAEARGETLFVESEARLALIQKIYSSASWRYMRPFRGAARAARRSRRSIASVDLSLRRMPASAVALLRRQCLYVSHGMRGALRRTSLSATMFLRKAARKSVNKSLDAATYLTAWWRAHIGRPRTLWGVTPILTLPLLVRCDRLLGLRSESLVYTVYYTSNNFDINLKRLREYMFNKHPRWAVRFHKIILRLALIRYDVFHFFCDHGLLTPTRRLQINEEEILAMHRYGRRLFTYAYGADVRTRKATLELGRYNLCAECPEAMKFCICDDEEGERNVARIRESATAMIAMGDMLAYIPGARNLHYWPIDTSIVPYVGVQWNGDRPLRVAHAPNHPHFKGTRHLVAAIEKLRAEGRAIELVRVQGVPNSEVMALFKSCDVVADQFVAGFHGYTALEAMALGKPVLCYLRNSEMAIDPTNCPIINAWPDTIYDVLSDCLDGRLDLETLGRRSRAYIEHYYSLEAVALRLGHLYLAEGRFNSRVRRNIARRMGVIERDLPSLIEGPPPVPWEVAMTIDTAAESNSVDSRKQENALVAE